MKTKKVPWPRWAIPMVLVTLGMASCGSSPTSPAAVAETVVSDKTTILNNLSLTTDLGARIAADGTALTEKDNPLGSAVTNTRVIDEVFLVSADTQAQLMDANTFLDASPVASALSITGTSTLGSSGLIKRPVAADMDGDGKQEVVVATFNPTTKAIYFYQIGDGATQAVTFKKTLTWVTSRSYSDMADIVNAASPEYGRTRDWNHSIDLAAADIDADGKDEIALTSEGRLYLLDDDFTELTAGSRDFTPLSTAAVQLLRVEGADLDRDKKAEIVVANGTYDAYKTAQISVFRWNGSGLTTLVDARSATAQSINIRSAEVKIGDVDGDDFPEIVLAGMKDDAGGTIETMILKTTTTSGVMTDAFLPVVATDTINSNVHNFWSGWMAGRDADAVIPILAVADLDGDAQAEIVASDDVLKLSGTASTTFTLGFATTNGDEILRKDLSDEYLCGWGGYWGNRSPDTAYFNQVSAGDINGDGNAEVVVLDFTRGHLRVFYYAGGTLVRGTDVAVTTTSCPYLVLPDIDNDSTVVEYLGHTLTFSDPILVAVLSSPPYWNKTQANGTDLIQNIGNSYTKYGKTTALSAGIAASFGLAVGSTLGATAKVPILANGEVEAKATVTHSFDVSFGVETTFERAVSFDTYAGQDQVLFTAIPIDIYAYRVLVIDPTETAAKVGDTLTITVARAPELKSTSVAFFNKNNGTYPDIDTSILTHTIGDPLSYPTYATAYAQILAGFSIGQALMLNPITGGTDGLVPEGNSYSTISYSKSVKAGTEVSYTQSKTAEFQVSFVALVGGSVSTSVGVTINTSYETGTLIEGSVGGLNGDAYTTANQFTWGIYSRPLTYNGHRFTLVDYYVN